MAADVAVRGSRSKYSRFERSDRYRAAINHSRSASFEIVRVGTDDEDVRTGPGQYLCTVGGGERPPNHISNRRIAIPSNWRDSAINEKARQTTIRTKGQVSNPSREVGICLTREWIAGGFAGRAAVGGARVNR